MLRTSNASRNPLKSTSTSRSTGLIRRKRKPSSAAAQQRVSTSLFQRSIPANNNRRNNNEDDIQDKDSNNNNNNQTGKLTSSPSSLLDTDNNNSKAMMDLLQTSSRVFSEKLANAAAAILMASSSNNNLKLNNNDSSSSSLLLSSSSIMATTTLIKQEQKREFAYHATVPASNLYAMNKAAFFGLSSTQIANNTSNNNNNNNQSSDDNHPLQIAKNVVKPNRAKFSFVTEDLYYTSASGQAATAAEFFDEDDGDFNHDEDFYQDVDELDVNVMHTHHQQHFHHHHHHHLASPPTLEQFSQFLDHSINKNYLSSSDDIGSDENEFENNSHHHRVDADDGYGGDSNSHPHHHQNVNSNRIAMMLDLNKQALSLSPNNNTDDEVFSVNPNNYKNDHFFSSADSTYDETVSSLPSSSKRTDVLVLENLPLLAHCRNILMTLTNQLSLIPNVSMLSEMERKSLEKLGTAIETRVVEPLFEKTIVKRKTNNTARTRTTKEEEEGEDNTTVRTTTTRPTIPTSATNTSAAYQYAQYQFLQSTNHRIATEMYHRLETGCSLSRCPILAKTLVKLICLLSVDHLDNSNSSTDNIANNNNSINSSHVSPSTTNDEKQMIFRNAFYAIDQQAKIAKQKALEQIAKEMMWKKSLLPEEAKNGKTEVNDESAAGTTTSSDNNQKLSEQEQNRRDFNQRELDRIRRTAKLRQLLELQMMEEAEENSNNNNSHQIMMMKTKLKKQQRYQNHKSSILGNNIDNNSTREEKAGTTAEVSHQQTSDSHHQEMENKTTTTTTFVYSPPSQLPKFVKEIRDSQSFMDVITALKLNPSQLVSTAAYINTTNIENNNNNSNNSEQNSHHQQQSSSLNNSKSKHNNNFASSSTVISAETFDTGAKFLPLDAITVFASKYECFIDNTASTNIHTNIDHGRKLIRRFANMQTSALKYHFPNNYSNSMNNSTTTANNNDSNNTSSMNINVEAATEVSLCLADLLLRHCEAPTLATQLLNNSRPVFEGFLKKMMNVNNNNNNSNSEASSAELQEEILLANAAKQAFKSKLASLRIRAACGQQPPNWKQALDHTRALPSLFGSSSSSKTTTTPEQDNNRADVGVIVMMPSAASSSSSYHHDVYSALQIMLSSVPAHVLKPTEWLEFARRFFLPTNLAATGQSSSSSSPLVETAEEKLIKAMNEAQETEFVEFKEEEEDFDDENNDDSSMMMNRRRHNVSEAEDDDDIFNENLIRQELTSMIVGGNGNGNKSNRIKSNNKKSRMTAKKNNTSNNNAALSGGEASTRVKKTSTTQLFSAFSSLKTAIETTAKMSKKNIDDEQVKTTTPISELLAKSSEKDHHQQEKKKDSTDIDQEDSITSSSSSASFFTPTAVFHQFCRVFVRSVEVHHSRAIAILQQQQQQYNHHHRQNNNNDSNPDDALKQQTEILKSFTSFVDLYLSDIVQDPHVCTLVLTSLVSVIQVKRYKYRDSNSNNNNDEDGNHNHNGYTYREGKLIHDSPTEQQQKAVSMATKLLGPLLHRVGLSSSSSSSNSSLLENNNNNNDNHHHHQPSRSLNMTLSTLLSKSGLIGMWSEALSVLSSEFKGTKKIADARTWSSIAHVTHRPHPANWEAALVATQSALNCHNHNNNKNNEIVVSSSSSSSSSAGDLEDITETATAALISLTNSDIAYSKRVTLAMDIFTRIRALRHVPNGDDELGTTQRMIAAFVDATTQRKPSSSSSSSSSFSSSSASMVGGRWADASELFSNFIQTRAVDVTSASRWLKNHSLSCSSSHSNSNNTSTRYNSPNQNHHHQSGNNNTHNKSSNQLNRDADAVWRGRFAGKGRLGDEQRLTTSLVHALSSSASVRVSSHNNSSNTTISSSLPSSSSSSSATTTTTLEHENYNTAMMLCGGDGPALLRACAESGSWHFALSTLNNLLTTTATRRTSLAEKRRWIENAALACLWAPKTSAYLSLQKAFPNAHLPYLLSVDGERNREHGGTLKSYIASHDDPDCDGDRFVSVVNNNHVKDDTSSSFSMTAEKKSNEKRKYGTSSSSSRSTTTLLFSSLNKLNSELGNVLPSSNDKNVIPVVSSTTTTTTTTVGSSKMRQEKAQPRTLASYEQQEIVDLTEKIYLMTTIKEREK